jgi:hypothetical protein
MSTISTSGISPNSIIRSEHLLRIINALSNTSNIDIKISGSLILTGSESISGSLNVTGGITGSLFGTATNSLTSSITTAILGTEGYVPVFTGPRTQEDSPIYVDGGRVGIGTESPNSKAILDLDTTKAGFLPPRMTTSDMNGIASPPKGLMIYNTTLDKIAVYNGSWKYLAYD